jgi:hypothetical protein
MERLLWASTGVKDKAYDDTRYVVDLATPDTVNTMPAATLDAVADHGRPCGFLSGTWYKPQGGLCLTVIGTDGNASTKAHPGAWKFGEPGLKWQIWVDLETRVWLS